MFGWRDSKHEAEDSRDDSRKDPADDTERRAADILRRLGSGRGDDGDVVDDIMRRVDERAETLREDEEKKHRSWW